MKPLPYTCYEAEVKIKDKSTLRPDANLKDGDIVKVQYGWIIEEQYDFAGQIAFLRKNDLWIPEQDLILLREITPDEYFEKLIN